MESAGITIQFVPDVPWGIRFAEGIEAAIQPLFIEFITKGLHEAVSEKFYDLRCSFGIVVTEIEVDEVESSPRAFYLAARAAIAAAYEIGNPPKSQ